MVILTVGAFVVGMVVESLLLVSERIRREPKMAYGVLACLVVAGMVLCGLWLHSGDWIVSDGFYLCMAVLPIMLCVLFKDDFLPVVNVDVVASVGLTAAYAVYTAGPAAAESAIGSLYMFFVVAILVMCLPSLIVAAKLPWDALGRLGVYLAYLFAVIGIAVTEISAVGPDEMFGVPGTTPPTLIGSFFWGMGFSWIMAHGAVFLFLMPNKHERKNRETEKFLLFLSARVNRSSLSWDATATLLGAQLCFLGLNLRFEFLTPSHAALAWALAVPLFFTLRLSKETTQQQKTPSEIGV